MEQHVRANAAWYAELVRHAEDLEVELELCLDLQTFPGLSGIQVAELELVAEALREERQLTQGYLEAYDQRSLPSGWCG